MTTKLGFIGLGGMGLHQARSFAAVRGCRVAAGSDPSRQSCANFAKEFADADVCADHRTLLKNTDVDAVVIAAPTLFHKQIAIDAMHSGRPVMVEKPMARTVADARRMNDVARKTGQPLMVAHCRRYDTDWGTFARVWRSGKLGSPALWRHVSSSAGPPTPWYMDHRLGGGPLMDGAVHNQDFANMLFGDPVSVTATAIKLTEYSAIDTATATICYDSGNQLMLSWSWGVTGSGKELNEVMGPKALLRFVAYNELAELGVKHQDNGAFALTTKSTGRQQVIKFKRAEMYQTQARHFLDCIRGKAECRSPGTEAIKAVASADAILKAAARGGTCKVAW